MARTTTYQVIALNAGKRGKLEVDGPLPYKDRDQAIGRAERAIASGKVGAYVVEVTGDAEFDDWDEPVIVFKTGRLPEGME